MTVSGILLKYVLLPYLASIAILYILSWILPPNARRLPSFFARLLASIGCLGLAASYGFLSAMLLRLVGKEGLTQWTVAKCFKYLMLLTTGVSVEVVEGAEYLGTRPAVYIGNHQSYVYFLTSSGDLAGGG
jgi:lysophosphatidate acyltransferase